MRATIDGNEAAASVAYRLNEVCCIYPITPSSPMAELADEWSSQRRTNIWGGVPAVVEMQSEGGAAGRAARGAAGRRAGHDVHRVAGPAADDPEHVQDRRRADPGGLARRGPVAGGAGAFHLRRPLRRDGGAADRVRAAGLGLGAGGTRPGAGGAGGHAGDPGAVRALLRRLPHLPRAEHGRAARRRRPAGSGARRACPRAPRPGAVARAPVHPRHRAEPRHLLPGTRDGEPLLRRASPGAVAGGDGPLAERTGRRYRTGRVHRPPGGRPGDRGDGLGRADRRRDGGPLCGRGERVGVVQVRLYRPFPAQALLEALPATVRRVAVLDRTKEPGSLGEPLFLDVLGALAEAHADGERAVLPLVIGGRYGLSSKEFTPGMVAGVFDELGPRAATTAGSPSGSTTTSRAPACRMTRRSTSSRRARSARCSSASAPTGRSARTRTRSRSSARPACTPRVTSSTTRRSPARRRSPTCASGHSRSRRPTWSRRPASSAATSSGCSSAPRCWAAPRPGATLLLNCPHPPDGSGTRSPAQSRSRSWQNRSSCT